MLIRELKGVKKTPEYQATDSEFLSILIQKLRDLGYKQYELGFGAYGVVYARPQDDYVIKIFKKDKGYESYLKFIEKFKSSPYVPRIRGKITKISNKYSFVRIEKLQPIDKELYLKIMELKYPSDIELREKNIDEFEKNYPGFVDFLNQLTKYTNQSMFSLDLNKDNIMMRNNTPVITDPLM